MTAPPTPVDHIAFYRRTAHCGGCGNPGTYCTCRKGEACGCADLHEMGSAYRPGALGQFLDDFGEFPTAPPVVSDDQPELFGGDT
jgi:hypothetical protein